MNTAIRPLILIMTLAAASLLGTTAARAQTPTVITSLPYTINTSGTYVLDRDLNSSATGGALILVNASNVTLDFQNHYIAGPANTTSSGVIGINASEKSNVTVRNGTVAFCSTGIQLYGNGSATTNSVGHRVENMRVTYCYYVGIFVSDSPASRVTDCQVSQTGYSGANYAYGIVAQGTGTVAQGNVVSTVTATNSYGINGNGGVVRQNTIFNAKLGLVGAKYQDNITVGCTTPFSGGTDAGGNN